MASLQGKVAWITGAGTGIGRATAVALAREGAALVLTGRREEALRETAAMCGDPGRVACLPADVRDGGAIGEAAGAIGRLHGRLDVVVNNAGMNVRRRAWAELGPEAIDQVLGTNLNAAFYVVAAALPLVRGGGGGTFIHVGSRAGRFWDGQSGAGYTTAKAALAAMSHSLNREEYGNGVRSTVVHPGETATDILLSRGRAVPEEELARLLRPEDVADVIRYVACLPAHVCVPELLVTPTWNRVFAATPALPPG